MPKLGNKGKAPEVPFGKGRNLHDVKGGDVSKSPRKKKGGGWCRLTPTAQEGLLELLITRWVGREGTSGHGMTDAQIGARMGVGYRTVGTYKKLFIERYPELREKISGRVTDAIVNTVARTLAGPDPVEVATKAIQQLSSEGTADGFRRNYRDEVLPEKLQAAIAAAAGPPPEGGSNALTVEQMLSVLAHIAKTAPPQYRIHAIREMATLQAVHRPAETFGPPAPLTELERVGRLTRLLSVVGQETLITSIQKLWPNTSSFDGSMLQLTLTPTLTQPNPAPSSLASSKPEDGSSLTPRPISASELTEGPMDTIEEPTKSPVPLSSE